MINTVGVAECHAHTWILALHELSICIGFLVLLKLSNIPLPVFFSFKSECLQTDVQVINRVDLLLCC